MTERIDAAEAMRAVEVLERLMEAYPDQSAQAMAGLRGSGDCLRAFPRRFARRVSAMAGGRFAELSAVRRILVEGYPEAARPIRVWWHDIDVVTGADAPAGTAEGDGDTLVRDTLALFGPLREALPAPPPAPEEAARARLETILAECAEQ